jgi:predicted RNase H-like HicB family nuclease
MKYHVLIHNDEEGGASWGECPELPGCFSQGDTPEELMSNMKEAIALYLDGGGEPMPCHISEVRELVV